MSTPIAVLELDLTGHNPANLINEEPQVLAAGTLRLIVPAFGAFFTEGLVIKDADTDTPLTDSQFQLMDFNQEDALQTGKEIYNTIIITDASVSSNVTVTYQALGGPYSRNRKVLIDWLAQRQVSVAALDWNELIDKPRTQNAAAHKHLLAHLYGMEYLVDGMQRINDAMGVGSGATYANILNTLKTGKTRTEASALSAVTQAINAYVNNVKISLGKEWIGLALVNDVAPMPREKAVQIADPAYDVSIDNTSNMLTLNALDAFRVAFRESLISATDTHIGNNFGHLAVPKRESLLSLPNGGSAYIRSQKKVVDAGGSYEKDIYPKGVGEDDDLIVYRLNTNEIGYGGIWMSFNTTDQNAWIGVLVNDNYAQKFTWLKLLYTEDLAAIKQAIQSHIDDGNNPHEVDAKLIHLEKVYNLPVITTDEIINKVSIQKYVTLDTLMYYMKMYMTGAQPPAPPGKTLAPGTVTMEQTQIIFSKCKDGTPSANYPTKGQLIKSYCDGSDKFGRYTDGAGGFYDEIIELNSDDCSFVKHPAEGTVLTNFCDGTTKKAKMADGKGGTYDVIVQTNSTDCGYTKPPAAGTVIATFCSGTTKMSRYADGEGGTYDMPVQQNSTDCGYVPVVTTPAPSQGTVIGTYCRGTTKVTRYADGHGAYYELDTELNSADCNGTPATSSTSPGTTSTPPSSTATPPSSSPRIVLSSNQTTIRLGTVETITVSLTGFTPNTSYLLQFWITSPTFQANNPYLTYTTTVTTNASGAFVYTLTQADNGITPAGVYDNWVVAVANNAQSNHITRTFIR